MRYRSYVTSDLAAIVPSVRRWKLASLPSYLQPDQIQSVIDTCKRDTPIGRRDYAILLLLARLGLRANEIVSLDLDDIDWHAGTLTVHGKGRRCSELPLPDEVGVALANYLERSPPQSRRRRVFIRHLAPHRGFASSSAVFYVARSALDRVGIDAVATRGLISSGIVSQRSCLGLARRLPRSVSCRAMRVQIRHESTRRSTSTHFVRSGCPGQEVCDERHPEGPP